MASNLGSLIFWLFTNLYFPVHWLSTYLSSRGLQLNQQTRPHNPEPSEKQAEPNSPREHYPKSLDDIHKTIDHLQRASPESLPAEILKIILFHANYDCIHYTASSNTQINAIARSATGPPARSCVTSPPLTLLGPYQTLSNNNDANSAAIPGRLRSLTLKFTGRDQGWTSDPNTSSWSWFEIAKTSPESGDTIIRGPVLAHNAIAGQNWQDFEIVYHVDEEQSKGVSEESREWIEGIRGGERVCVIPMARYGGWQCRVLKASVQVEVEVWY